MQDKPCIHFPEKRNLRMTELLRIDIRLYLFTTIGILFQCSDSIMMLSKYSGVSWSIVTLWKTTCLLLLLQNLIWIDKKRKAEGEQIAQKLQGDISVRWPNGHAKEHYF